MSRAQAPQLFGLGIHCCNILRNHILALSASELIPIYLHLLAAGLVDFAFVATAARRLLSMCIAE
jgi:hypothetical protein